MKNIILLAISLIFMLTANGQTLQDKWVEVNEKGCKVLDPYYSEGVRLQWDGACINGKANGYGKLIKYKDGEYESTYEGEYKAGIREGKGKFTHTLGSVLECNFINGQAIGYGKYTLNDRNRYEGDILNYREHGNGTLYYANGTIYEGYFVSDEFYTGKVTNYKGEVSYKYKNKWVDTIPENPKHNYKPKIGVQLIEYFDENWERCEQKEASFYRLITYESENKPKGMVRDFYMNGVLQSEFYAVYIDYDDQGKNFCEGKARWYFNNGKLRQEISYFNNEINGKSTEYYKTGQIKSETNYNVGVLDGVFKSWYKTGNISVIAKYTNGELKQNKFIVYDENGLGQFIYHEDFDMNNEAWNYKSEKSISEVLNNNTLRMEILGDNYYSISSNYIILDHSSDYSIEAVVQKLEGNENEYGLLFGFMDWDNYYQFVISNDSLFRISGKYKGLKLDFKSWTVSSYIYSGNKRNSLKMARSGNKFFFLINGHIVYDQETEELRGNNFGVIANGKGVYVLESLTIREELMGNEFINDEIISKSTNSENWMGNGTGFFIDKNGYIATNYHVVDDAKKIEVEFVRNGTKYSFPATVVKSDKQNDLSIIKIDSPDFKAFAKLPYNVKTETSDVGSNVFALGYPMALSLMGTEIKFTDGKISSKTGMQGDIKDYQISVPIQPGNSGGPLFDYDGNIVGITSATINRKYDLTENVNYAIKSSYLKNLVGILDYKIVLPDNHTLTEKTLTEKIKILSDYVVLIKVK